MLTLQTYHPVSLSPVVKSCWYLKVPDQYAEDIFPDGHHELIFHAEKDNAHRNADNTHWISEPTAFIAGQNSRSYSLKLKAGAELYGIRFYPHTIHHLLRQPAYLSTDNIIPLNDITAINILAKCITADPATTFGNFERELNRLLYPPTDKFKYIDHAVREIMQQYGQVRIDQLLHDTGVSPRYFDGLFKEYVGMTPKAFCNIIRLNYFISYRNKHPENSLTACAYEAAFFDQSHLINNFKTITGKTPREYFKADNNINDHFTIL